MSLVSLFCLAFAVVYCSEEMVGVLSHHAAHFELFKIKYEKSYTSKQEHDYRLGVFKKNLEFVEKFDAQANGFTVALNKFADLHTHEFKKLMNGLNITKVAAKPTFSAQPVDVPSTWDWRTKGAVTAVKNQQQCGSCWAFSATGSTEGAWFLAKQQLVSLSEQNLVDCSTAQGNNGCNGGLMDQAFQYIEIAGIDTEASYPYTATGPNTCEFDPANVGAKLSSYNDITSGSESGLLTALAKTPVSIAIDASQQSFQFYSGGVYNEPACSSSQLDHGVLAVGWGTYQGSDYWLVKNSWGTDWGLSGYIMMSRNLNNQCGVATAASYPIV